MKKSGATSVLKKSSGRRLFLQNGMIAAGAAAMGSLAVFARDDDQSPITRGDIAILRFLQALETVEADLWLQYSELGGIQDNEVSGPGKVGNPSYTAALTILDGDMPQYIHDNTDDENSHAAFLSNYLKSKGVEPFDLTPFRVLPSSQADGANKTAARLTNLTQLTIDTSFWSRYRSITNPDFDLGAPFVQAVPSLNVGQHTAIPRTNDDTAGSDPSNPPASVSTHLQAIAFTAGFHFAFIEQGGTSLYPTLAQQVSSPEVLRILLSIGPSETMHFQTWQDKAGNALAITDTDNGFTGSTGATVSFSVLSQAKGETDPESLNGDTLQANLIMPEPCHFLNQSLGPVAIIRPTSTQNSGAVASVMAFANDGLFIDPNTKKNTGIVQALLGLAEEADEARR